MGTQINVNSDPRVVPLDSPGTDNDPSLTDAERQALYMLGELAALANEYENYVKTGAPQSKIDHVLAQINKIYGYFHINGNTVTFDYNEGAQPGTPITNPQVIDILKHIPFLCNHTPPTGSDIASYADTLWNTTTQIHWSDGQDQTLVERILTLLAEPQNQYSMASHLDNQITNIGFILFYLSLVNTPGSKVAGTLDDFLKIGYYNGSMQNLGNIAAIAAVLRDQVATDPTIWDAETVQGLLSIQSDDPLFSQLEGAFQDQMGKAFSSEKDKLDWSWQARFFPFYAKAKQALDALPYKENTELENRMELEKKLHSHDGDDLLFRISRHKEQEA